ncbi:nuclear transport factor 2 family protein [Ferdinandcohnia sp. Marseille-Q9671]
MSNQESLKVHLEKLEKRLLSAEVRTSPKKISELLDNDFFEFGSSGNIWFRKDFVGESGIGLIDVSLHNFEIRMLAPHIALATYIIKDNTQTRYSLRSSIWKQVNGLWRMSFHQGTITKAKSVISLTE